VRPESSADTLAAVNPPGTDADRSAAVGDGNAVANDLRRKTADGALIVVGAQLLNFVLRMAAMALLARLLLKSEFGLVGMVLAFTGFLSLFRDAGLSMATIQRETITNEQTSTLFWVNVGFGCLLFIACIVAAPILAAFFAEPRLFWITIGLGSAFLFNGAMVQHRALLQRDMRFGSLAVIDTVALMLSSGAGVAAALLGWGYWSLVISAVGFPALGAVGTWLTTRWVPALPQRASGVRSMLVYGGKVTLNSVVVYAAYNADKVLIGRLFGADALGVYGRAYQLINLPTENLNHTIGQVAFPALSRVQGDPQRLRNYFLKGYSLFLSIVVPITVGCALFANDIIRVFLGPNWTEAVLVFQLLAPTILVFALINPFAWLMLAAGQADRSLKIAFAILPTVVVGYLAGSRWGIEGVAAGFSLSMVLLVIPFVIWAKHGTAISHADVVKTLARPFVSILLAAALAWALAPLWQQIDIVFFRLVVASSILFGAYFCILLFGMGQKAAFMEALRRSPP
jgi:O-antigen/teichoic acid export membrane protein